jgi:hypothetical protein
MFTMAAGLGVRFHFPEAECLDWQIHCSGGQREIRDRELPHLIEEQRELTLDSPAFRQTGKECQFNQQTE